MDLLGIGPMEIIAILLVVVLLFPAKNISQTARTAGRFLRDLYRSEAWKIMRTASDQIQQLPSTLVREAELEDLKEAQREIQEALRLPEIPLPSSEETTPPAPSGRHGEADPESGNARA